MGMPRGGGFNPNQMLKQLQKMQREMEDTQAQLAEEVVEGTAGGGVVTQDDFPRVIEAIARAADAELGAGAGLPAARPNEVSRARQ